MKEIKIDKEKMKMADLTHLFGSIKERKMSAQEAKDMVRKGWEPEKYKRDKEFKIPKPSAKLKRAIENGIEV